MSDTKSTKQARSFIINDRLFYLLYQIESNQKRKLISKKSFIIMLPHITNSQAGVNRMDPVHASLFEVYFTIPEALRERFGQDEAILTEQVLTVSGLGTLDKGPGAGQQKFMGSERSFLNPKLDQTHHEITVKFALNLRNKTDNFIYKLFKAWARLGYNISNGETTLKQDYCADWLRISYGNRAGDIYRDVIFKDVMLAEGLSFLDSLDYSSNDAAELEVKFISDWADDLDA